ncbi:SCO2322 family protein [Streptomyces sp. CRN 30]|uniref:SCO2322 family protein n=1 Tax=Streptomyces sp. CRN 30 TaxID=3075613 RepID=UPI002A7FFC94|nr:SCO2322 family protein [Streptomyces sp. CRN 30]
MIRRAALLLSAALLLVTGAGQAQAAGYRYWSFWERAGDGWTYATEGPSTARPDDGDVQGFRFAVSEDSGDAAEPRGDAADAAFAAICAKTPARDGDKRVALVLDFGTAADAPSGETPPRPRTVCARVADDATTADALAAVAGPLRYDTNALLCAIDGYPRTGCGEAVADGGRDDARTSRQPADDKGGDGGDGGPSVGLVAGIAVVAGLGAAAVWQGRRRRNGA